MMSSVDNVLTTILFMTPTLLLWFYILCCCSFINIPDLVSYIQDCFHYKMNTPRITRVLIKVLCSVLYDVEVICISKIKCETMLKCKTVLFKTFINDQEQIKECGFICLTLIICTLMYIIYWFVIIKVV
jgi:hypothetical protein